ncbi:Uncharacterized protein Fot_20922 [Forsythia ovata]|uniref:Uncharacterized protein n=1 Tax=Forsythia ovata TaxID=205694 RepID=A0ABD1UTP9_9LAMI
MNRPKVKHSRRTSSLIEYSTNHPILANSQGIKSENGRVDRERVNYEDVAISPITGGTPVRIHTIMIEHRDKMIYKTIVNNQKLLKLAWQQNLRFISLLMSHRMMIILGHYWRKYVSSGSS